ncbi:PhnJ protein [Escherichia coli]|uniref:PhnJ protein n=1 Tax=Escherichia coli TaxID=562 RepID=A0A2X1Q1I3_ECOLX|nr:PhnJ protein [Escherichia coli]
MDPSPIPKFDNPKMDMMPALQLFGAGREKRIYAVPPFTRVESLDFDDHPFTVQQWDEPCAICGSTHSYLDEVVLDDAGNRMLSAPIPIIAANRARQKTNESTVTFGQ